MLFHRPTPRTFLLLIGIAMIMYHFTLILIERNASHSTTKVWEKTDAIIFVSNVPESVYSQLPQSPLDDELLKLQLPLVRLVKHFGFHINQDRQLCNCSYINLMSQGVAMYISGEIDGLLRLSDL